MKFDIPFHTLCGLQSGVRLGRMVLVAWMAASVLAITGPAQAQTQGVPATLNNAAATERLITEFGDWIGKHEDAENLVTTLRSGRATHTEGPSSVVPATGPLGYGEVRLALKLAQGALIQQGVVAPDAAQLQAALHGGVLRTPQGELPMDGVLPQKAQGAGWAAMAQRYGLSVEDMLPPPGKAVTVKSAAPKAKAKPGTKAKASAKGKAKPVVKKAAAKPAKKAASSQ